MEFGDPPFGGTTCFGALIPNAYPTHLGNVWHGMTQPVFTAPRLSDDDVERIALRVVELLKATP